MGDITRGLEAGFIATVVVSIALYLQDALGFLPDFHLITLLTYSAGTPGAPLMAWLLHFAIGIGLWGSGFAVVSPHLPGPHWLRGMMFGVAAWLAMMMAFLPSAGLPMFAQGMGLAIPFYTLGLNLLFGFVMGESYHLLLHYLPSEVDENA